MFRILIQFKLVQDQRAQSFANLDLDPDSAYRLLDPDPAYKLIDTFKKLLNVVNKVNSLTFVLRVDLYSQET